MDGVLIPEVFFKGVEGKTIIKYRLAFEWKGTGILVCIPANGDKPYAKTIKMDELSSVRYYR